MKYLNNNPNWEDVVYHLRNKNLAIFYRGSGFIQRMFNRLSYAILKLRGGKLVVSEQIIEYPLVFRNL